MQTLSVGLTSLMVDDETASAVVWYSVQLAKASETECVEVAGLDLEGRVVSAQLVLGSSAAVSAVTAHTRLPEPDNAAVLARIREDTARLESPPGVVPEELTFPDLDVSSL